MFHIYNKMNEEERKYVQFQRVIFFINHLFNKEIIFLQQKY